MPGSENSTGLFRLGGISQNLEFPHYLAKTKFNLIVDNKLIIKSNFYYLV